MAQPSPCVRIIRNDGKREGLKDSLKCKLSRAALSEDVLTRLLAWFGKAPLR